jgi:hypothetical protein
VNTLSRNVLNVLDADHGECVMDGGDGNMTGSMLGGGGLWLLEEEAEGIDP